MEHIAHPVSMQHCKLLHTCQKLRCVSDTMNATCKANTELQAKVNELQEMVERLSADGPTAEHRTQDCKVYRHMLCMAGRPPMMQLHCHCSSDGAPAQNLCATCNFGGGSALRQLATKAHGKPHSRAVPSNVEEQSTCGDHGHHLLLLLVNRQLKVIKALLDVVDKGPENSCHGIPDGLENGCVIMRHGSG